MHVPLVCSEIIKSRIMSVFPFFPTIVRNWIMARVLGGLSKSSICDKRMKHVFVYILFYDEIEYEIVIISKKKTEKYEKMLELLVLCYLKGNLKGVRF